MTRAARTHARTLETKPQRAVRVVEGKLTGKNSRYLCTVRRTLKNASLYRPME